MSDQPSVELVSVTKRFGQLVAVDDLTLEVRDGEFFSLLGPSGCGKTTTLRMIGGFETPSEGSIFIAGELQGDLPPYRRPVNTVFQSYALFPHMSVYQNVAFGLEMSGRPKDGIGAAVARALEMVQLSGYEQRRPSQLSGGQQQRVALARALINRPRVLLLDEPLGALDLKLRKAMQLELKALQERLGITFIYVTHDQEEALTMSDRIAVMNQGVVHQLGDPQSIYEHPRTRFIADFIGETNFMPASVQRIDSGVVTLRLDEAGEVNAPVGTELSVGQAVTLAIRPEKLNISSEAPAAESVRGSVREVVYLGTDNRYLVAVNDQLTVVVRAQNTVAGRTLHFERGDPVYVGWDRDSASVLVS